MRDFIDICKKPQVELKKFLSKELHKFYKEVITNDGYIYAKGDIPYALTAHMDTVHKAKVKDVLVTKDGWKTIISSKQGIGGDDRCGVWIILQILKETDLRPTIIFCEDEEIGGVGSAKFCKSKFIDDLADMNYLIELDRMNANDAVFYDCDNPEFTKYITELSGYKENWGSFSDISHIAPACGVAAVNLSCGYYKAHTTDEYVVFEEMENTKKVVEYLVSQECEQFEYIESVENYYYGYKAGSSWGGYIGEITYLENGIRKTKQYECFDPGEAIMKFATDHPDLNLGSIIDVWFDEY